MGEHEHAHAVLLRHLAQASRQVRVQRDRSGRASVALSRGPRQVQWKGDLLRRTSQLVPPVVELAVRNCLDPV
jgi:hypothetical protein